MIQLPAVFPDHDQIRGTAKNQIHRRNIDIGRAKGQNRGENQCVGKAAEPFDKEGDQRCEDPEVHSELPSDEIIVEN